MVTFLCDGDIEADPWLVGQYGGKGGVWRVGRLLERVVVVFVVQPVDLIVLV